ncbi:MAG: uroporphyrinogen decarboxylase family protein [Anaerolineae bacterium]
MLTARQLVIERIAQRETASTPYTLSFEGDVAQRLDVHYGSSGWRTRLDNAIVRVASPDLGIGADASPSFTDRYGSVWQCNRRPAHLIEPALKDPSLQGYHFPEPDSIYTKGWEQTALDQITLDNGHHFLAAGFGFGLFERTWTLRGFNEALMDAIAEPAFYQELVTQIADHQLALIDHLVELPIDSIMFSDDWGYQQGVLLGPDLWRKFIKPQLARQYERVHRAGKVTISHCCGSIVDIIPDLIDIGLDVLESVQPEARGMNPYELKRRFGSHITFWGGLGSQSTIPFGTPADIRSEVAHLCAEMGHNGGYILAPAKSLQPETPTENAAAVVEAFVSQSEV